MGDVKVITLNQTYVFFKRVQDESLELPEALVYSRSAALFHDRFGRLQNKPKKFDINTLLSDHTQQIPRVHTSHSYKKLANSVKTLRWLE